MQLESQVASSNQVKTECAGCAAGVEEECVYCLAKLEEGVQPERVKTEAKNMDNKSNNRSKAPQCGQPHPGLGGWAAAEEFKAKHGRKLPKIDRAKYGLKPADQSAPVQKKLESLSVDLLQAADAESKEKLHKGGVDNIAQVRTWTALGLHKSLGIEPKMACWIEEESLQLMFLAI